MFAPQWYTGTCSLCGALVGVKSGFMSFSYMTCNMAVAGDHTSVAHSKQELATYWQTGRYLRREVA